ncbi:MAG: acetyl-CoA hydrolase [Pseudomonadota bacterium]|nr:acetyl-CoA hydrolase [Pseudomonadota bacterium]
MNAASRTEDELEATVDRIIATVGKRIVLGLPLGLGKPVELVNALYRRAERDSSVHLRILTALSLEKPRGASAIEQHFMQPFVDRVFAGVPDLDYVTALGKRKLPANVEVCEFYFRPGSMIGNPAAQQHYVSSNYTHAARDVFNQGCNVSAQSIARRTEGCETRYSLSCNPDTSPELAALLRSSGRPHLIVGVVNQNLPFMTNDAEVGADFFDVIVDNPQYSSALFPFPKLAVNAADYAIGLNASTLVRDGGTLQIGIGALGDALVHSLQLRHQHNAAYRSAATDLGVALHSPSLIEDFGGLAPFEQGLYSATEMFVDGFLHLMRDGILKRRVYDFWAVQQLINEGRCDPQALSADVLDGLESLGVRVIRGSDFEILQNHGFFSAGTRYDEGHIIAPDGERVVANVAEPKARDVLVRCLGESLRNGICLHGGFFLGPAGFYASLRDMEPAQRDAICMTSVYKTNQLDHNPRLYQQQRREARFINTGMMATLSGAVCSDGLDNLQVVSGVGGQYNFVAMAHQLQRGRSILLVRAARERGDGTGSSNIIFNYGHTTIPRHLRDIIITEYGIADLRSRTDSEVAQALIEIADSRFQKELLEQAQRAGKIPSDYRIPEHRQNNRLERIEATFKRHQQEGRFAAFPLGCDFTADELKLGAALKQVQQRAAQTPKWKLLLALLGFRPAQTPVSIRPHLRRLKLDAPQTLQDRVAQMLVVEALASQT